MSIVHLLLNLSALPPVKSTRPVLWWGLVVGLCLRPVKDTLPEEEVRQNWKEVWNVEIPNTGLT